MTPSYYRQSDPASKEVARYGLAAAFVLLVVALTIRFGHYAPHMHYASPHADSVIMIDLPPQMAASAPKSDAEPGPPQPEIAAAPPTPPPPPPLDVPKPAEARAQAMPEPAPVETLPPMPDAVTLPEQEATFAPPPPPPPPAAAQAARAPQGADVPDRDAAGDEAERARASAKALTAWQRGLSVRLQTINRALSRRMAQTGAARIAFTIDRGGKLLDRKIDQSSGSASVDAAALDLVQRAAPFPPPPAGTREADLKITVQIRVKR